MVNATKLNFKYILQMDSLFVFLFLVLFPFGQLIRIGPVHPIDVVVGLAAFWAVYKKYVRPTVFNYLNNFLIFAACSWLFSLFIFPQINVTYGLLYLMRLAAYIYFLIYVANFTKQKGNSSLLIKSILGISILSGVLGWVQFFIFPDLKPLFIWGWDMHLYRLAGTFFDPGYLGLILVLGFLITIYKYIVIKRKIYILFASFLLISLAYTYSRASYLSLLIGLLTILIYKKSVKIFTFVIIALAFLIIALPTTRNHSIEFFRAFSVTARIENYKTTLNIFTKNPVFGIGYNNMCIAYQKYVGFQKFSSHACSGSDSSMLFVLATTGTIGLMAFIHSVFNIIKIAQKSRHVVLILSSLIAVFIHSFFNNSLFYPWIMGWVVILLAEV
jgi:O-antigen ligase